MNRPLSHSMASHTAKTTVWSSYQKSMIFIPTGFIPMVSIEQVWLSYLCGQQCNLSQLHFETATQILGRCISCYKNKRGAEYCRLAQQHKAIRATACCECEQNGNSVTKCQQELHCDGENTFYMNKVTSTGSEIPQCCLGLQCLQMKCYSSRPGEMNVTGYMVPYSDHNWEDWFQRFTLQTGCEYTIRSGKQSNTQLREKGVMKMEGKLFTYPSAWSHAYSCLRGDTGRFKSLCLGKKNRSSLGTTVEPLYNGHLWGPTFRSL